MRVFKIDDADGAAVGIANITEDAIRRLPELSLGLSTGYGAVTAYKHFIQKYNDKKIDFSRVSTFSMDEYIGIEETNKKSHKHIIQETFLNHVNVAQDKIHWINDFINKKPKKYDKLIKKGRGIDLLILDVKADGSLGFNAPGSNFKDKSLIVEFSDEKMEQLSQSFAETANIPKKAITMGIKSIMNCKFIIVIALGKDKAKAVREIVEGTGPNKDFPCSILGTHPHLTVMMDEGAASLLEKEHNDWF